MHFGGLVGYSVSRVSGRLSAPSCGKRGTARRTVGKHDGQLEESALPFGALLTRHADLPLLQIKCAITAFDRLRKEAKGMVLAPLLAVEALSVSASQKRGRYDGQHIPLFLQTVEA